MHLFDSFIGCLHLINPASLIVHARVLFWVTKTRQGVALSFPTSYFLSLSYATFARMALAVFGFSFPRRWPVCVCVCVCCSVLSNVSRGIIAVIVICYFYNWCRRCSSTNLTEYVWGDHLLWISSNVVNHSQQQSARGRRFGIIWFSDVPGCAIVICDKPWFSALSVCVCV